MGKVTGIMKRNRKRKVKFPFSTLGRHIGGAEVYLHSLLISVLDGGQLLVPVALTLEIETPYLWSRRPHSALDPL
jgi:hypothetical protein